MNSGIKATLCITLVFALMAGIATGCKVTATNTSEMPSSVGDFDPDPYTTVPSDTSNGSILVPININDGNYESARTSYNGKLPDSGVISDYNFTIIKDNEYTGSHKQRGCYFAQADEPGAPFYIAVCSGEKNTGGYDIKIVDIGLQNGELVIMVEETSPVEGDVVIQAFTYPCCVVKFDKLPSKTHVINTQGQEFEHLSSTDIDD